VTQVAKVGAFFLIGLILVGLLVLKIQDIHLGKTKGMGTLDVHFKDVAGLDDKSAVRIAGVRIGKVDGVKLLPDGTAVVHLRLDKDVELHEGAMGQIRSLGLLGDKYVELAPGDSQRPKLADGARLEGSSVGGFDDLQKLAGDIGRDMKQVSAALAASLGGPQGAEKIDKIVDNIGALSDALRKLVEANQQNFDLTVLNLKEFSGEIRETLARLDRIVEENRRGVHETVENVDEMTGKLKTTADNLNAITEKINTGKGTIGKLLNDEDTHKNLNEALQSVKTGVESLNTTLSRVNRIQLDLGFRAEFLKGGYSKQSFTLDATPRENKFYRLEVVALPKGKRTNQIETTTTTLPDGTSSTITRNTETLTDTFGVSLQLGYRLNNTVVRAGLIESRGGLAIDQLLWNDRMQVTGEAWDFGKFHNGNGKVKIFGRWNATPNMYVQGGMEDILNSPDRSIVIGAGIRWKDEDIKSLFGLAPLLR
jgi:phospholipid/cholesterol/gamma-HCH transport system substrate-binding protein